MIAHAPLETARVRLEPIRAAHAPALLRYYTENEAHLAPWEPARPPGFLSLAYWRSNAEYLEHENRAERSYGFVAFERDGAEVVAAQINLWNILRGVSLSATLGYSLASSAQGRGLATEAVGAVVDFALDVLGLHRVVATYQPTNDRSGRLLRRLGFGIEGYSRDHLFIGGAWRDSILTARLREDGR